VIAWQATGDTDNSGWVRFRKVDDSATMISVSLSYQTEGVTETVGDVLDIPERQLRSDLARFKEFIESRGTETGGWRDQIH